MAPAIQFGILANNVCYITTIQIFMPFIIIINIEKIKLKKRTIYKTLNSPLFINISYYLS